MDVERDEIDETVDFQNALGEEVFKCSRYHRRTLKGRKVTVQTAL